MQLILLSLQFAQKTANTVQILINLIIDYIIVTLQIIMERNIKSSSSFPILKIYIEYKRISR